ncbi:hypothetical protein AVEN_106244-1 [Araneus ventricosus]|uniref:Uncharacterized protein n=1 Tax=Araneus ventricosus TaxID=182803 RepID=A0A4Y2HHW1_ARAVE|nr:hypothetical protein AVEN_106244-1 [Araneus ventricosus]
MNKDDTRAVTLSPNFRTIPERGRSTPMELIGAELTHTADSPPVLKPRCCFGAESRFRDLQNRPPFSIFCCPGDNSPEPPVSVSLKYRNRITQLILPSIKQPPTDPSKGEEKMTHPHHLLLLSVIVSLLSISGGRDCGILSREGSLPRKMATSRAPAAE